MNTWYSATQNKQSVILIGWVMS